MGKLPPHDRPSAIPWPPLLLAVTLLAGYALGRLFPLPWPGIRDLPAQIIGYGLGAAGVALIGWGVATLYGARTTLMPTRPAGRLVTEGAFRFRRNPIYMGEVLTLLGLAEAAGNIWLAIMAPVFAVLVLALAILPEERHLEARFGEDYLDYKQRTRRWF
jgi:protein-S-isoprenylcysteine O-methyltransferase Ste14